MKKDNYKIKSKVYSEKMKYCQQKNKTIKKKTSGNFKKTIKL